MNDRLTTLVKHMGELREAGLRQGVPTSANSPPWPFINPLSSPFVNDKLILDC
jgi:hypothetical protein